MSGAAGKIVHDRFHITKHVSEAVERLRKQEHRELMGQEDHRLTVARCHRLYREENLPDIHRRALGALKAANPKGAKAWAMKKSLNGVWKCLGTGWVRRFVKRRLAWVSKSGLAPMRKVGGLIQWRLENILASCLHWITNGVAEGLNCKIMAVKRKAYGYRNRDHFKITICFFGGGLDLCPVRSL